ANFQSFDNAPAASGHHADIEDLLGDVQLKVQVVLGNAKMSVEEILQLANGSVVELDKLAGDPLDILVNDRLVAKGEVLVLNENFCIRITDIIPPSERA
ncbi:MAG: flagellar motor switch protein FliN, partial [Planctomycetes bacterium]|nr:flagellar motor switch protein FliN [Planctomycetota bacterium]